MNGRQKFIISLLSIFGVFIILQVINLFHHETISRSADSLFNQYYKLVKKSPEDAKRALDLILASDPHNIKAQTELAYWYLNQGDTYHAMKQFEKLKIKKPDILATNKPMVTVSSPTLTVSPTPTTKTTSTIIIAATTTAKATTAPAVTTISKRDQLLNEFYQNRNTNPTKAWHALHALLARYPNDVAALKEAGYYALGQHKNKESVMYFERAYALTHDPVLALQSGYILDGLNDKREAYHYFDLATNNPNLEERLKAELAKTNLRGVQTKFLPEPFFANILFYPFYRSRFKLIIYPVIAKVGMKLNQTYNVLLYLSYRRTQDNKSTFDSNLPQIYEDDAAITSLGIQATPFPSIPLSAFMEAGKAVDLIYRNRARWRNDFRTGLFYYNDWGKEARYTFKPTFYAKPNMDIYADAIYFSRFLNTIGTLRARPGFEVFRYGASSINVYMKGFLSQDDSREFYNNYIEYGPSIAFTPYDRYNFTIRYENLRGIFLPAGSPSPNPYSKTYHNNVIMLETYIGF